MATQHLPHTQYINAIETALTTAHLTPAAIHTLEDQLDGHPLLRGTLHLTPDTTGTPADLWPHGLHLTWEWHTGTDPRIDRGPTWAIGALTAGGWVQQWAALPVDGWAAPEAIAAVATMYAHTGTTLPRTTRWQQQWINATTAGIHAWELSHEAAADALAAHQ